MYRPIGYVKFVVVLHALPFESDSFWHRMKQLDTSSYPGPAEKWVQGYVKSYA